MIEEIEKIETIEELFAYMEKNKGSFPDAIMIPVPSANFREGIRTKFVDPAEKEALRKNFLVIKAGGIWEISEKKSRIQKAKTPVQILVDEGLIKAAG